MSHFSSCFWTIKNWLYKPLYEKHKYKSNKTAWGIKFVLLEKLDRENIFAGSECEPGQCEVVRVSHGGGGSYRVECTELCSRPLHLLLTSTTSTTSRSRCDYSGEVAGQASQSGVSVSLCGGMVGWDWVPRARQSQFTLCRKVTSTPAPPPTSLSPCRTGAADVVEIAGISPVWSTGCWRYHQPPVRYPTGQTPAISKLKVRLPAV